MATAVVEQAVDAAMGVQQQQHQQDWAVQLQNLQFSYPGCGKFLQGMSLDLPKGSRTLLLGANGAGKTTLLQLIAGKYMVGRETIRVLQQSPFYDMVSKRAGAALAPHTSTSVSTSARKCRPHLMLARLSSKRAAITVTVRHARVTQAAVTARLLPLPVLP